MRLALLVSFPNLIPSCYYISLFSVYLTTNYNKEFFVTIHACCVFKNAHEYLRDLRNLHFFQQQFTITSIPGL